MDDIRQSSLTCAQFGSPKWYPTTSLPQPRYAHVSAHVTTHASQCTAGLMSRSCVHKRLSPQQVGLRTGTDPGHLLLAKALLTPDALNPLQQQEIDESFSTRLSQLLHDAQPNTDVNMQWQHIAHSLHTAAGEKVGYRRQ